MCHWFAHLPTTSKNHRENKKTMNRRVLPSYPHPSMARLVRPPPKPASLVVRCGRWAFLLLVAVIVYYSLSFYELYAEEKADLATLRSRIAVVYAAPTFHEEVASVVACVLHDLGFYVVVYIGNGWHVGGMMVPFSGRRKRASEEFYGRCVSQFVTITSQVSGCVSLFLFAAWLISDCVAGQARDGPGPDGLRHVPHGGARRQTGQVRVGPAAAAAGGPVVHAGGAGDPPQHGAVSPLHGRRRTPPAARYVAKHTPRLVSYGTDCRRQAGPR
jgi:hypothetical protein